MTELEFQHKHQEYLFYALYNLQKAVLETTYQDMIEQDVDKLYRQLQIFNELYEKLVDIWDDNYCRINNI